MGALNLNTAGGNLPIRVSSLVLAQALADGGAARIALFALIGLLLLTLGFLIGYMVLVRRRPTDTPPPAPRRVVVAPHAPPALGTMPRRAAAAPMGRAEAGGGAAAGAETVAVSATPQGPMACPSCRREFEAGVRFCPHDARKLVAASDIVERARNSGAVCPRCRRAYDGGVRFCPHDAEELIPAALYEATHGKKHQAAPTGVLAKLCPLCATRYDLVTTFCAKDGAELVTIN